MVTEAGNEKRREKKICLDGDIEQKRSARRRD